MRHAFANQLTMVIAMLVLVLAIIFAVASNQMQPAPAAPQPAQTPAAGEGEEPGEQISAIPHPLVGYENCSSCHGLNGMLPYPPDHEGWPDEYCAACHEVTTVGN
ncbi:MAG TPA: hypothetical protein GYA06_08140 [Chloroflexi bacterium]|jgi:mono/diheme cytochrome c family protein|nr:hypothetical protein [Chloroflexota bacterium]HPO59719.1 hypothetical protein [Anaerolineaceae bacterium]